MCLWFGFIRRNETLVYKVKTDNDNNKAYKLFILFDENILAILTTADIQILVFTVYKHFCSIEFI